jgi:hypothetical protein
MLALRKLANGKILWGGVGSGKSRVAAAYYEQNEAPKDVYVITTAKKRNSLDWESTFAMLGIGPRSGPIQAPRNFASADDGPAHSESNASDGGGLSHREEVSVHGALVRPTDGGSQSGLGASGTGRSSSGPSDVDHGRGEERARLDGQRSDRSLATGERRELGGVAGSIPGEAGAYPYVLTVDSWNNIGKYADVAGAFFIFDEQRVVGSGKWSRQFIRISKRNTWLLLSATPGDTWLDYIPVFVANNFYKNRSEFLREHVVYNNFSKFPKVDRYINIGRLAKQKMAITVEMPFERHTRRRQVQVPLPYDKEMLDRVLKDRWHVYKERPLRDVGEMFSVARRVVNSDPSRLEMVCELWQKHPKLIVFYNFNYELESLRSLTDYYGINSIVASGNGSASRAKPSSNRPSNDSSSSTSLSIPSTPNLTNATSGPSRTLSQSGVTEWTKYSGLTPSMSGASTTTSTETLERTSTSSSEYISRKALLRSSLDLTEKGELPAYSASTPAGMRWTSDHSKSSIAEWNGHKKQPIPDTDRWLYLVQYIAGAEAWECTSTDAMIMYSRNYSWKITQQAYGRIDRLNTAFTDLWYYNFTSESFIDKAVERSLKAKKNFNEAEYAGIFVR